MPRDVFGRLVKMDIFGREISSKQLRREVLDENRRKGKAAEESYVASAKLAGYEVERTGKGHDFRIKKKGFSNRESTIHWSKGN